MLNEIIKYGLFNALLEPFFPGQKDPRIESSAIREDVPSYLLEILKDDIAKHPGQSGFHIMEKGHESLKARLALIRAAQVSLDLQYYAINNDVTSNLLIETVIQAADRGVRVRFLLDDISTGKVRRSLLALNMIENIEVRIFNPITTIDQSLPARLVAFFMQMRRNTKRMHNKILIADNVLGITGGRNLGDEYFDAHADISFKDIDVLAAGNITRVMSENFDAFWNNKNSYSISVLHSIRRSHYVVRILREKLRRNRQSQVENKKQEKEFFFNLHEYIKNMQSCLVWAKADLAADLPEKVDGIKQTQNGPIDAIRQLADQAQENFLVVSPYFVPRKSEVEWLQSLEKRGVHIRIITNSLASTDVVAVHTGYKKHRLTLLQHGIELFELKMIDGQKPRQRVFGRGSPSDASLHAKVYVVDKKTAVIGSSNFDPRSQKLNTELALVIHSMELSEQLVNLYQKVSGPESSYQLMLEGENLMWSATEKGNTVRYTHEPQASIWRRLQEFIFGLLPIEGQL